jgi:hypothetical protein
MGSWVLLGGSDGTVTLSGITATVQYLGPNDGADTNEIAVQQVAPIDHTFTRFYCHLNSDPGAGTTSFQFRVNQVDVGDPCSFEGGNSGNVTDSYSVQAGDLISIALTDTTSGSAVHATWAME